MIQDLRMRRVPRGNVFQMLDPVLDAAHGRQQTYILQRRLCLLDGTSGGDGDGAAAAAAEGAPPPPAVQLVLERGHFEGGDARFALFVSALRPGAASHGQHCH